MAGSGSAASIDPIRSAHARLVADPSIQFAWAPPPPPPRSPSWLEAVLKMIGHVLELAAPFIRVGLWALLVIAALGVVIAFARQLLAPAQGRQRQTSLSLSGLGDASQAAQQAGVRLEEADRLASAGLYADATHLLLLRGVADVGNSRAGGVRPSLTAREIAALPDLPPQPRAAFAFIARVVEQAVFGGGEIDAGGWVACREAYEALVRPQAWTMPPSGSTP